MTIPKFTEPRLVLLRDIVLAIQAFEREGKNPHGPNVANPDHVPVMLEIRFGGPPKKVEGSSWPVDPELVYEELLSPKEIHEKEIKPS